MPDSIGVARRFLPLLVFSLCPLAGRGEFLQEDRVRDPALAVFDGSRVEGVAIDAKGRAVAGGAKGLFREEGGQWRKLAGEPFSKVAPGRDGMFYAASGDRLFEVEDDGALNPILRHNPGPIGDFAVGPRGDTLVAGPIFEQDTVTWQKSGKFQPKENAVLEVPHPRGGGPPPLAGLFAWSVACDAAGVLWIAAKQGLFAIEDGKLRRIPPPGEELWILGEKMDALTASRSGGLLWGHDNGLSRYEPATGAFTGMRPDTHGVPLTYPRAIAEEADGSLWIGGRIGAARRAPDGRWTYYQGQAWLPHDGVLAIACAADGRVLLGTESGLGVIGRTRRTLAGKAAHFEEVAEKHHFSRQDCMWQVTCKTPGDISTANESGSTDNDGTWSADYLAGECLRYAVTKGEDARRTARRLMDGILMLETVTGIPGYPARAYVPAEREEKNPDYADWHRSADGKYLYKGDTSSDEIVGHFLAHSMYYDFVAEESEKPRLRERVKALADHILDHGLTLVERKDGEPTRWGIWSPERCWEWGHYWYSSGLWSLCILSHLKVAHHMTGDARYDAEYRRLIEKHDYARRTIKQKVTIGEINHSDDQMAIMTFYPLLRYEEDPALRALYLEGLKRSWEVERPEHSPLWNFIDNWAFGNKVDLRESIEHLEDVPWMLYKWSHDNSRRFDLPLKPFLNGEAESARALGMKERGPYYLTDNPYTLRSGDEGRTVETPAIYTLPYWLGRYYGLIGESD
jgi:hypothetical protein